MVVSTVFVLDILLDCSVRAGIHFVLLSVIPNALTVYDTKEVLHNILIDVLRNLIDWQSDLIPTYTFLMSRYYIVEISFGLVHCLCGIVRKHHYVLLKSDIQIGGSTYLIDSVIFDYGDNSITDFMVTSTVEWCLFCFSSSHSFFFKG